MRHSKFNKIIIINLLKKEEKKLFIVFKYNIIYFKLINN